ncbi:hypothetical protein HYALB_00001920 [Hymenoscyphus albidus]|uniref:Zn(2)-C6 fungal-type domain-containing protein n=1 Tax=Hymenoscyphus albidus TaxID=595503 RepID=A0A9N9LAW1_9HELO|nr:hypothetical protein HYALB_00001920 [Hymenoscyphus albidus]
MQQPRKRAIASCSQCYLRKQKCDRQYPCCHCIRRRRPEICSYAVQHSSSSDGVRNASKSTQENRVSGDAHNIADDYRGLKRVRQENVDQGEEDNDNDNSNSPTSPDLHGRGQNETGQDTSESSELGLQLGQATMIIYLWPLATRTMAPKT